MNSERQSRAKRSSYIINVIQTTNGFSIVEGTELLNKAQGSNTNHTITQPLPPTSLTNLHSTHSKEYKPTFKKTNLVFLKKKDNPIYEGQTAEQQKHIDVPSYCKIFAEWFDLNKIHELQYLEVIQWFCEKMNCSIQKAQEREDLSVWLKNYKKHRNFIVTLYIKQFAPGQKYLSANCIRRYISFDAFWLMKIHLLLTNFGIINSHSPNFAFQSNNYKHVMKTTSQGKKSLLAGQLDLNIKTKEKEDQNELLKRLTKQIRPFCDFCRIHCGIVWFQHNRSLDPKEIANIMKNVNSKNPPLSQKEYEYILCVRCYCQGNFPLLLTHHDFKKICINDRLEPNKKKKNKRRKREKRRKQGQQQGDQQNNINGQQQRSHVLDDDQEREKKKQQVNETITKLIDNCFQKQWNLQETDHLLYLVQLYGQDWQTIHQEMRKKGYCETIETQQIILYFLSLPRRGICKLQEQYQNQKFIHSNFKRNNSNLLDKLASYKLNNSIKFVQNAAPELIKQLTQTANNNDYIWKQRLNEMIKLHMTKISQKIQYLQTCQGLIKNLKIFIDPK